MSEINIEPEWVKLAWELAGLHDTPDPGTRPEDLDELVADAIASPHTHSEIIKEAYFLRYKFEERARTLSESNSSLQAELTRKEEALAVYGDESNWSDEGQMLMCDRTFTDPDNREANGYVRAQRALAPATTGVTNV